MAKARAHYNPLTDVSLTPGTRIGSYEITGPLGEGGMGEVYRARDTKLNRDVAIKMLPESVALDHDRLARFEREARTLAALNHPHIAQIYGLEDAGARGKALVMELVGGETLAERIAAGPLSIPDTLEIARQIADALEAAHADGIVHRDLKPANIKVRDDGTVKVLDFGLAKGGDGVAQGFNPADRLSDSPTFTSPAMTERGIILGTAAYMAPEQARGKPVDKRADIWAFGVVVFEMLTGKQMFAGETVSDTLAAVLREDINWNELPALTPPALRRVLERTLQKDPKRRLRDIGDARLEIEDAIAGKDRRAPAGAAQPAAARPDNRLPWAIAAGALIIAAATAGWALSRSNDPETPGWSHFTQVTDSAGEETSPALSPDGNTIAFASRARGTWDIYTQRVGGRNRTLVLGDPERHERGPAFSPDGQRIAFHEADDDGGVFVAGATGESVRRLSDIGFHPAWSPDGKTIAYGTEEILTPYSRTSTASIWMIEAAGGTPRQLTTGGDAVQPSWSPSGKRIVYWSNARGQRDLFTVAPAGGEPVPLLEDGPVDWAPVWMPDGRHVMFSSDRGGSMNLWRIAVDENTGAALGEPEPVTASVQAASELASISSDGMRIAFKSRVASVNPTAIPFDPGTLRAGAPSPLVTANILLTPIHVSADGRAMLMYNTGDRQEDIFVTPTDRFEPRRLTDDAARDRNPMWMPDGKSLVFYSTRGGRWEIWHIKADGAGLRKIASVEGDNLLYPVVSPTGDRIVFSTIDGKLYVAPFDGSPLTDLQTLPGISVGGSNLLTTDWSRDGRRLTGTLVAPSGRQKGVAVYDIEAKAIRQVSADETPWVRWLPDSRHVLYIAGTRELVAVDTATGARKLIVANLPLPANEEGFAISPDGRTIYYGAARSESDIWIAERAKR